MTEHVSGEPEIAEEEGWEKLYGAYHFGATSSNATSWESAGMKPNVQRFYGNDIGKMNTNDNSKDHLYLDSVWVFNGGVKSNFPGGVFTKKELAEDWIKKNALTGTLTRYPLDIGVYEWAISNGAFNPKRDDQKTASFIGRFSSASQEHYHYQDGNEA